ncbi:MAG: DUF4179 domain-containing protein [Clostridia bacterium]|nr:DUF4179 domain-containing protein [Clostridia bacterium]
MTGIDNDIREAVDAFIPPMSEEYNDMIEGAVSELKQRCAQRNKPVKRAFKPLMSAAAILVALILSSAILFGAHPALAAEMPVVSDIVYAAAAQREANAADRERIEKLLNDAVYSLAVCDYDAASRCFRENSMNERENYLAAAYLNHLLTRREAVPDDANAGKLEISEIQAEQKAFRFTVHAKLSLTAKDGAIADTEECTVRLWKNTDGIHIEGIEMQSEAYCEYVKAHEKTFGAVPESGASFDMLPIDNGCLSFSALRGEGRNGEYLKQLLLELESVSASDEEKAVRLNAINILLKEAEQEITPDILSAEETASELMYRYWLGKNTGEVCDFSDIMERNEETDLFFRDALLNVEDVELGISKPLVSVKKGTACILETYENTGEIIRARFHVQTHITDGISRGVGEEIILTLRKDAAGFTVIDFDRDVGDGYYTGDLKPAASRYKAEGYSWQEAGELSYEELHARLLRDAEWLASHNPGN